MNEGAPKFPSREELKKRGQEADPDLLRRDKPNIPESSTSPEVTSTGVFEPRPMPGYKFTGNEVGGNQNIFHIGGNATIANEGSTIDQSYRGVDSKSEIEDAVKKTDEEIKETSEVKNEAAEDSKNTESQEVVNASSEKEKKPYEAPELIVEGVEQVAASVDDLGSESSPENVEILQQRLSDARIHYIQSLAHRGNIIRHGADKYKSHSQENEKAYSEALSNYARAVMQDSIKSFSNDVESAEKDDLKKQLQQERNREIVTGLVKLQQQEQNEFDKAVAQNVNEDSMRKFRNWYYRHTKGRLLAGGSLAAAGYFIPMATPVAIIGRTIMGSVGGAAAGEAILEKNSLIGHKGLSDRLTKVVHGSKWERFKRALPFRKKEVAYEDRVERMGIIRNQIFDIKDPDYLSDEEVLDEVARLRALQVAKATDIKHASAGQSSEIADIIEMLVEREADIITERLHDKLDKDSNKAEVLANDIQRHLQRELRQQGEEILDQTDRERVNRLIRRLGGFAAGAVAGTLIGSRGMQAMAGETTAAYATFEQETVDNPLETPLTPEPEVATAPTTEVITPPAPEFIGSVDIVIDEKGEGMIRAIAQYLESEAVGMDHESAMAFANKAFEVGEITQGKEEMFNLVHIGDHFSIDLSGVTKDQLVALDANTIKSFNPVALSQGDGGSIGQVLGGLFEQPDFVTDSGYAAGQELGQLGDYLNSTDTSSVLDNSEGLLNNLSGVNNLQRIFENLDPSTATPEQIEHLLQTVIPYLQQDLALVSTMSPQELLELKDGLAEFEGQLSALEQMVDLAGESKNDLIDILPEQTQDEWAQMTNILTEMHDKVDLRLEEITLDTTGIPVVTPDSVSSTADSLPNIPPDVSTTGIKLSSSYEAMSSTRLENLTTNLNALEYNPGSSAYTDQLDSWSAEFAADRSAAEYKETMSGGWSALRAYFDDNTAPIRVLGLYEHNGQQVNPFAYFGFDAETADDMWEPTTNLSQEQIGTNYNELADRYNAVAEKLGLQTFEPDNPGVLFDGEPLNLPEKLPNIIPKAPIDLTPPPAGAVDSAAATSNSFPNNADQPAVTTASFQLVETLASADQVLDRFETGDGRKLIGSPEHQQALNQWGQLFLAQKGLESDFNEYLDAITERAESLQGKTIGNQLIEIDGQEYNFLVELGVLDSGEDLGSLSEEARGEKFNFANDRAQALSELMKSKSFPAAPTDLTPPPAGVMENAGLITSNVTPNPNQPAVTTASSTSETAGTDPGLVEKAYEGTRKVRDVARGAEKAVRGNSGLHSLLAGLMGEDNLETAREVVDDVADEIDGVESEVERARRNARSSS